MSAERTERKHVVGEVISDGMDKTITVRVDRRDQHARYGKYLERSSKFHVHDEEEEAGVGDTVEIAETRPISKTKRWRLVQILETAPEE